MNKLYTLLALTTILLSEVTDFKIIQSDFNQSVQTQDNKQIVYRGIVYLQNPNIALWRYLEPIKKDIFIENKKITIIEYELFQATNLHSDKELNIIKLFNESKEVSNHHRVGNFNNNSVDIFYDKNFINKIKYKDEIDNTITLNFFNQVKNIDIVLKKPQIPNEFDILDR